MRPGTPSLHVFAKLVGMVTTQLAGSLTATVLRFAELVVVRGVLGLTLLDGRVIYRKLSTMDGNPFMA